MTRVLSSRRPAPGRRSRHRRAIGPSVLALLAVSPLGAQVRGPAYNRRIASLDVEPSATGRPGHFDVSVRLDIEILRAPTDTLDLGTEIVLRQTDGKVVDRLRVPAVVPLGDVETCGGLGCPGPCGTGEARGRTIELECRESDMPGIECSCTLVCPVTCRDCVFEGDLVAEALPAPGALPEPFTEDDTATAEAPPPVPSHNRSVGIQLVLPTEDAPLGTWDVYAVVEVQLFEDAPTGQDLSTQVTFRDEDLQVLEQYDVPIHVLAPDASQCPEDGCPDGCGSAVAAGLDKPMDCAELPGFPQQCGCTVRVPVRCKGCPAGSQVVVEVQAAPGSQPEEYLLDDRDEWSGLQKAEDWVGRSIDALTLDPQDDEESVEAHVGVEVHGSFRGRRNTGSELVIREPDGTVIDEIAVPSWVEGQDVFTCAGLGCPGPCGTGFACGQWVDMVCKESDFFRDCGCFLPCVVDCGDCVFGEDFTVELRPGPGAVGEFRVIDDFFDCNLSEGCRRPEVPTVFFRDFRHEATGKSRFRRLRDRLIVTDPEVTGEHGVRVRFPEADAFRMRWDPLAARTSRARLEVFAWITGSDRGAGGGGLGGDARRLRVLGLHAVGEDPGLEVALDYEALGASSYGGELRLGGEVVGELSGLEAPLRSSGEAIWPESVQVCAILWCLGGGCYRFTLPVPSPFETEEGPVRADTVVLWPEEPDVAPSSVSGLELALSGLSRLEILEATSGGASGGEGARFLRGNANDAGEVDISDGIYLLGFLFTGGPAPPCLDAADTDDSGAIDISDGIAIFNYLFTGGPPPASPGPFDCGGDPTEDDLGCETSTVCP